MFSIKMRSFTIVQDNINGGWSLIDEMPIIPAYYLNDEYLAKPYVTGVMKSYIGHTLFEYADINK